MESEPLPGLPPVIDGAIETLILGSFPSPSSLAAQQYYAHRQNQFWRVLAALLETPLADYAYADKQRCLLAHRIGLWDVYRACRREGALDAAIVEAQVNDFSRLPSEAPHLKRVCFNGKTSGKLEAYFRDRGYATCVLPSTSPAYTLALARKVEAWRAAGIGGELRAGGD